MNHTGGYLIYVIRCIEDDRIFVGKTTSKNANFNPMRFFLKKNEENQECYRGISKSIKDHGLGKHVVSILYNSTRFKKIEAEEKIFSLCNKLKDTVGLINDEIIDPERVVCEACGKKIRKNYLQRHKELYCDSITLDYLNDLLGEDVNKSFPSEARKEAYDGFVEEIGDFTIRQMEKKHKLKHKHKKPKEF